MRRIADQTNLLKAMAFFRRDFLIETSYKMAFFLSLVESIFPMASFFFIAKLMEDQDIESLAKYGGEYFPFVLIGVAFTRYFQLAIETFSITMRRAQMEGCLEAILSSQTNPQAIVFMSSLYSFFSAGIQLMIMFVIGTLFLGFSFSEANIPAAIMSVGFSFLVFISLGIISAAGTILFKKGEPFGWVFGALSGLLGGAFFPIEVMPSWLQFFSIMVPITYALEAIRLSFLQGYTITMLSDQLLTLCGMGIILLPISLRFFEWAVEKGKKEGSLVHY